ncbi:hypothetical protein C5E45_32845 [Nocardia nova]|uniref:Phage Gp37/Gp68 family protein n=1 Tax=Nocardia nova TaxID=37330 RepID=A0A2S6ACW8_9NOCA|nr:phage Gp37/Gp68 family protein [Nocardia nova]PPJ31880.1 hypothetical protein C5E45_32845 [Nocardia nova]
MSTHIEWTDETWNPVTGCTRLSEGCERCYIERTPPMRMAGRRFDGPGIGATTGVLFHPERLTQPLGWRKPRRVFVNSMSDLFHDDVPAEYIARVWATMAATPQHTYQVLTKRPGRMRSLLADDGQNLLEATRDEATAEAIYDAPWPLPNVWLGVSTESQKWADVRIPQLLDTPAAVRFISAEPLLGPIGLHPYWMVGAPYWGDPEPTGPNGIPMRPLRTSRGLDWVIAGGESGPGARPMHRTWVRSLRDQCELAGVPFLFKQWGEWVPESMVRHTRSAPAAYLSPAGDFRPLVDGKPTAPPMSRNGDMTIRRAGKAAAGRHLDGRTWDQYPEAAGCT